MTTALPLAPGDELLDHPDADAALVASSLHHIARSNWWFGGWWAVRRGLELLLGPVRDQRVTLLDIGTGKGDLPRRAVAWGRRRGITIVPMGIDRHPVAASMAAREGVATAIACAGALPFAPGSVDVIVASQLLHHLAPQAIVDFTRTASRIARLGVVVADLRRSTTAMAGFWIGSRLLGFDRATRDDGLTSVRRGFSAVELTDLLRQAGAAATVRRTAGFRLMAAWKTGAAT